MPNAEMLLHQFDSYVAAAQKAYKAGNYQLARNNYIMAAKAKYELAEFSTPALREAQIQAAKKIVETVTLLDATIKKQAEEKAKKDKEESASWTNKSFVATADKTEQMIDEIEKFISDYKPQDK